MPARARILVVEDEARLGDILRLYLERDGHRVTVVGDGQSAIAELDAVDAGDAGPIDLVVLDLMLPSLDGETVLAEIRDRGDTPVLIASAKRSDLDRIAGLRSGADDYLAKPFNPNELTARVAAILRRSRVAASNGAVPALDAVLSFDGGRLIVDGASRRYILRTRPRSTTATGRLTPGELGLLGTLARRPGAVFTREQLLESVTRRPDEVFDRVVDVHVANLRRKVGDDPARPWLIETIPQTGYRLVATRDQA
jgi:DNA-binding response OmpR family regulator